MRPGLAAVVGTVLIAGSACSTPDPTGPLRVSAASSLRDVLPHIEVAGLEVVESFAGSQTVTAHVLGGAPVDVVITADAASMERLVDAGALDGEPVAVATNELVVVVPAGNPAAVGGLDDLADPDLVVVVGAPEVPVGRYTHDAASDAGVTLAPDSLEANVAGVVSKVASGEADAGVAYASDVRANEAVEAVPLGVPSPEVVVLAAAVRNGRADVSALYVAALAGAPGRAAFRRAGFGPPPAGESGAPALAAQVV